MSKQNDETYIKLYRKAKKDEDFKTPGAWQLFTYCLMRAEPWSNGNDQYGTFQTTYNELSEDTGQSRASISKFLKILKEHGKIDYWTDHQKTTIKVINFRKYNPPSK